MKIVHCAETIKGGIASYLRELIIFQCETFGPSNVILIIPASQLVEIPVPVGVVVIAYPHKSGRINSAVRLAWVTLRFCLAERPKIIHIHSTFAGASIRPLLALARIGSKVIYCPHGWAWDRPMNDISRFLTKTIEKLLSYVTDTIICISEHEKNSAISAGLQDKRLVVVLNGVSQHYCEDFETLVSWPPGEINVLFIGRFDHQKGVDLLFRALENLNGKASAVLIGGNVLGDADNLDIPDNAVCLGWMPSSKLEKFFNSAHVLVMPSRWEGFGLVAVEAMRAGLPVIATRVGGLPEIVIDGETGVLIPPGNADALAFAIADTDLTSLKRMGVAGRNRFLNSFTVDRVHREICEIYYS